jgi:putative endonuclease
MYHPFVEAMWLHQTPDSIHQDHQCGWTIRIEAPRITLFIMTKIGHIHQDWRSTQPNMPNHRRALGQQGEQMARQHLLAQGYAIIECNWHCQAGELDIIARDGDTLVFVEVKTRTATTTESAWASITPRKRAVLETLAETYMGSHAADPETLWRIDVIAIAFLRGRAPVVEHVQNALDW